MWATTEDLAPVSNASSHVEFLSLEPLLGPLPHLDLRDINWVIVGGESGPGARPMKPCWVTDIRDQCRQSGVAFFFKQWGGTNKKRAGRTLEERPWDELPVAKQIPRTSDTVESPAALG